MPLTAVHFHSPSTASFSRASIFLHQHPSLLHHRAPPAISSSRLTPPTIFPLFLPSTATSSASQLLPSPQNPTSPLSPTGFSLSSPSSSLILTSAPSVLTLKHSSLTLAFPPCHQRPALPRPPLPHLHLEERPTSPLVKTHLHFNKPSFIGHLLDLKKPSFCANTLPYLPPCTYLTTTTYTACT